MLFDLKFHNNEYINILHSKNKKYEGLTPRIFIFKSCSPKPSHIGLCTSKLSLHFTSLQKKGNWGSKSILISQSFLPCQVSEQSLVCWMWNPSTCLLDFPMFINLYCTLLDTRSNHTWVYMGNHHSKLWPMSPKSPAVLIPTYFNVYVCVCLYTYIHMWGRQVGHF